MIAKRSNRAGILLALLSSIGVTVLLSGAFAQVDEIPDLPSYLSVDDNGNIVMSPTEAARWALQRNTDLQIAATSVEEALGKLRQAWAIDNPTVNAKAMAMWMGPVSTFELPMGPETTTIKVGQDQLYQATVSVTQPLYTGGRAERSAQLAQAGVAAAKVGTDIIRLSVALGAREVGYGVLRATQLAGVAASQVTAIAEHVRHAELMEQAGVVPHFDVVQANTELARARQDLIAAQTAVEQLKAQMRQVLALPHTVDLTLVDPPPPEMPVGELPDLIDQALANHPQIQAAEARVRIARINLELAQRDMSPSVALTGSYSRQTAGGLGSTNYSWQVGIVAEKPIVDGGAQRGKVEAARAQLRSAELQLRQAQEQIALEVVRQFLAVNEAQEKITAAEQGVEEARERRRMAQLRYREGIAAGIEVLDADTALAAAEANLINAQYDLQLAIIRLRTALGMLDLPEQEVETP